MNTKLGQKAKYNFEKTFFMLMNNAVFRKTMENIEILNRRYIKLVTTEWITNYFVSEPNYQIAKFFRENVLAIEMRKNLKIYE